MRWGPAERVIEAQFSPAEVEVLDEILRATAVRGAHGPQVRHRTAALLQTKAGRSLCRQVQELRQAVRGVAPPREQQEQPIEEPKAEEPKVSPKAGLLRTDWPSGEWTEEIGAAALAELERSGLGETLFCRATGISRGRIRRWRERLTGSPNRR